MSHSTSETVECPLCGEEFDPTATGGWCTNSDCGEWQHEAAAEVPTDEQGEPEGATDDGTDGADAPEDVAELFGDGSDAADDHDDADRDGTDGDEESEDAVEPVDAGDGVAAAEAGAAVGDPDATEPADDPTADVEPAPGETATVDDADETADDAEAGEDADLACPSCGETVAAEDNFCANCGEDVSALEPGPLTACPACEEDVEPEDNFCANCGEGLDAYRSGGDTVESGADDDRGAADRADDAATEPAASGADDPETEESASLVLVVRNREVQVWDGDTVGRTIRSIVMNTGGDEDDALRIHREHVQFVREGGQFHLVALGQNSTVVNGESVDEGDRVPVSPGDRIELSGVAKMRVEAP